MKDKEKNMEKIIESPLHYMGNKYKLLSMLKELFPNNINKKYYSLGKGNKNSKEILITNYKLD